MPPNVPIATYRLQLTAQFTFDDAAAVAPYLASLGITHVYASPFLKARAGSTHGYDIIDHTQFNPELGGEAGFERFSAALKAHDLGLILDFVPNHMGVHFADNAWWLDILEWGQKSPFADAFDIDWDTLPFRSKPGLLVPVLGAAYGDALSNGDIALDYDASSGSFSARYFEHCLPIAPQRYSEILRKLVATAGAETTAPGKALLSLAATLNGPNNPERDAAPQIKQRIAGVEGGEDIIRRGLDAYRAGSDRPAETLALHHLLERQHYRLAHWRLATSEINYRRFFDVNALAGLRVERRDVFERMHTLVARLIADDRIQGLRLDHIDGLRDPMQYCQRLHRLVREAQGARKRPFYLLVEKILGEGEKLPSFPGVDGTTGYEWLNDITQVLVEPEGLKALDDVWRHASNAVTPFEDVLRQSKRRVIDTLLASEFTVLVRLLARIAAGHYSTRDYSQDSLRQAFELFVLHFPLYRTYIAASGANAHDRALIDAAIGKARHDWFNADAGIFDFLRDVLTLDLVGPGRAPHSKPRVRRFALKVQQFTGPLMAKSLEDTTFYRYSRLIALNEVGGDAAAGALPLDVFHDKMKERARRWPHGLTATATHDTKRGEDARARILALAELSDEWSRVVGQWKTWNARCVSLENDMRSPEIADEYMLYQALVGALPIEGVDRNFIERMQAFAQKAIREAKQRTSWLNPDERYEKGVAAFIARILDGHHSPEFVDSLATFCARTSLIGALNTLTQITLKATLPGVPDFYQGTELWDFSLVDPDNRRPVDFKARAAIDAEAAAVTGDLPQDELARDWQSGRIKLFWTRHLLACRRQRPALFTDGDYLPLPVTGRHAGHVVAFARVHRSEAAIVVALRHFAPFTRAGRQWPDFRSIEAMVDLRGIAAGTLENLGLGEALAVGGALQHLPAALLTGAAPPSAPRAVRRAKTTAGR